MAPPAKPRCQGGSVGISIGDQCVQEAAEGALGGSVLPEYGIMHLFGEVSCESVSPLISFLHSVGSAGCAVPTIRLYVNSDGGSFEDGFALVDTILDCPVPVETICIGRACSIALPVFLSGSTRYVAQHAYTMFHGVSVDGVAGVVGSIKNMATEADHCNKMMTRYVCSRSRVSSTVLKKAVAKGQDLYFYPDGMVANGMAHFIGASSQQVRSS